MLDRLFWKGVLVIAALILCCGLVCRAVRAQEAPEHGPPHHDQDTCWWTTDPEARCKCECRKEHCKQWMRCSPLAGDDYDACTKAANDAQKSCEGGCFNG